MKVSKLIAPCVALCLVVACSRDEPGATAEPAAEPASDPVAITTTDADLRTLLAGDSRPEEDRARDAGRRPVDVLAFLGIETGMAVLDVMASGGYYTEVLSLAVGPEGSVVAHNTPGFLQFRDGYYENAISERLAGNRLPNVTRLNKDFAELSAEDGQFDAAITALNFHDIYNRNGKEAAVASLQGIGATLKPGGVLGVIDHVGAPDADNATLHRIDPALVVETATAAGFVVAGESDILGSADDAHTLGVFDEAIRGKTDRFLLKLEKPSG